jgi:uncharacterized protein with FMN-binding domain
VRKGTKSFIGIVSLGLVAAGYQAGQAAEISTGFAAAAPATTIGSTSVGSENLNTPEPIASDVPTTQPTPVTTEVAVAPAPVASPKATTAAPTPVSSPKATTAAPAPAPAPASTSVTKSGSAISYRFGTVQVSVTKANGKITAVNLLQQGATGGRQSAFSYLVQYAIQANGSSFGNLGGATFTTDAFKQSLDSALAKF